MNQSVFIGLGVLAIGGLGYYIYNQTSVRTKKDVQTIQSNTKAKIETAIPPQSFTEGERYVLEGASQDWGLALIF